ncbi:hypothetical protein ACLMAJ_29045 [Nocardia sp. KC 131]|uniref:hypothetical protein n=1 Tax=Nocardia arseniciresistens TaxID=3392119 RepID=UPI00398F3D5C
MRVTVDQLEEPIVAAEADVVAYVGERGRRDFAAGQVPDDRSRRRLAGWSCRSARHRVRQAIVADDEDAVTGGVDVSTAFFDGRGATSAVTVLVVWATLGAALCLIGGLCSPRHLEP